MRFDCLSLRHSKGRVKLDVLDPDLPIIDAHHHLWDLRAFADAVRLMPHPFAKTLSFSPLYMLNELYADALGSGHNIVGTVFMECNVFYRLDGPASMRPVGEVEAISEIAAQSASGAFGSFRACGAIVGHADLTLGAAVGEVLDAEIMAGGGRMRGIRHSGAHDPHADVLGSLFHAPEALFFSTAFREGFAELGKRGLVFDAWVLEPQLDQVIALARAFPDQPIILDHCGTPLGIGPYKGTHDDRFATWEAAIRRLAACPNVSVKLGGLAMPFPALGDLGPGTRPTPAALAALFRPYIEPCIEAFGTTRAMFESNFPVDRWGADYATIWSSFKILAGGASAAEKSALFGGTAAKIYGLEHLLASPAP